jgi:hypothetical protein
MSRNSRKGTIIVALAITALLALSASSALAGSGQLASNGAGPVATKGQTASLVSWVSGPKLKVAKRLQPLAVCSVACSVTGSGTLKGFGQNAPFGDSGSFAANQLFGLYITIKGQLLKLMKREPGKFKINETLTATDPATGATQSISRTFRLKR